MPDAIHHSPAPVRSQGFARSVSLDDIFKGFRIDNMRNAPSTLIPCRMAFTPGKHERTASGVAISMAFEVLQKARQEKHDAGAGREVKALDKIIGQFGVNSKVRNGGDMQPYLTVLGAMHGALALRVESAPDDVVSARLLAAVRQDIINIGIRAGRCKGVPDGTYQNDEKSWKLAQAIKAAKQTMVECASEVGNQELLRSIAHAVLPSAMRDSTGERNPEAFAAFSKPGAAPDMTKVLESRVAGSLQEMLETKMESGTPEGVAHAILHLLKSPQYIKMDVPGSRGEAPDTPEPLRPPADPLPGPAGPHGTGAPWAYNYAPVTVKNDFTEFMKHLDKPPLQLTDLRNLLNDSFQQGYALGQAQALNTQQQKEISDLKEQLRIANTRLNLFAKGPDLVRVPRSFSDDNVNSTEQQDRDTAPQNEDREPLVRLDPSSPRNPRVPDLSRQQNQLDQQNRQDNQTTERSDQRVNNGGNGNGGPRDNNRAPEDDGDNTSPPVNRASSSRLPDDEALNRLDRNNQNNQNQRQRLGSGEQRLENQRNEQNQHLQKNDSANQSGGTRGAGPGTSYAEYTGFLQAAGYQERTEPRDEHEPPTKRREDPDVVNPSAVAEYVKERSARAGTPYVPSTAKLLPPVVSSPGRFNELIQLNGAKPILPSFVVGNEGTKGETREGFPALPKQTDLQMGMEAFFTKSRLKAAERARQEPVTTSARSTRISDLTQSLASSATKNALDAGDRSAVRPRSASVDSVASTNSSSSGGADDYARLIVQASARSSGALPLRSDFPPTNSGALVSSALAQLAKTVPSAPVSRAESRTGTGSPSPLASSEVQHPDVVRKGILNGARVPRGESERPVTFSDQPDPLAGLNVEEVLNSIRDDGAGSVSGSSVFSLASDRLDASLTALPEDDVIVIDPVKEWLRSGSQDSLDSGRGSPSRSADHAIFDFQPAPRSSNWTTVGASLGMTRQDVEDVLQELRGQQAS